MTRTAPIAFLLLGSAWAQTHPDFTGVWEMNPAKMTKAPPPNAGLMRAKIDHTGDTFAVTIRQTVNGNTQQENHTYRVGQESRNQMHGAPMTSRAAWEGADLVIQSVATFNNKELRLTDRFSISADGGTLTFRERHQFGTDPEGEDVMVFDRKPAASWEPDQAPKPAEEVYQNIQIMKGVPATRIPGVMANLTKWLGVDCAHCHVPGEFDKDDKPAKETTRKMFRMVRTIGTDFFAGNNPVTCWTCHRGQAKPQSLPPQ